MNKLVCSMKMYISIPVSKSLFDIKKDKKIKRKERLDLFFPGSLPFKLKKKKMVIKLVSRLAKVKILIIEYSIFELNHNLSLFLSIKWLLNKIKKFFFGDSVQFRILLVFQTYLMAPLRFKSSVKYTRRKGSSFLLNLFISTTKCRYLRVIEPLQLYQDS